MNKKYPLSVFKKSAFTLAETLIVMGIIGVVAALTLPNLNSSTGDKEKVIKLKKIYQNLNDAMGRAVAIYGPYSEWTQSNDLESIAQKTGERLTEFMKLSKNCELTNNSDCFPEKFYINNGEESLAHGSGDPKSYKFITADGSSLAIAGAGSGNNTTIYVDIDGINKGSNHSGKDVFGFDIVSDTGEIIPVGDYSNFSMMSCNCFSNGNIDCTSWVIMNENMDYLKCPSKLSATNTSCK